MVGLISDVFGRSFYSTLVCTEHDIEIVEKNGLLYVLRFRQAMGIDDFLNRESRHDIDYLQPFSQSNRPLELTISNPGSLDTLCFIDDENSIRASG